MKKNKCLVEFFVGSYKQIFLIQRALLFLSQFLHLGVGELLFWGSFAKKYKPFGESRIQFGVCDTFWQNLIRFGKIQ